MLMAMDGNAPESVREAESRDAAKAALRYHQMYELIRNVALGEEVLVIADLKPDIATIETPKTT